MTANTIAGTATLIVVTGRPGAGKTTLTHSLAKAIRCPALHRDEIKEGLVNALPSGEALTDALQRRANDAFFGAIELLLRQGVTLVAEAAFQHKLWAPRLEPLRQIARVRIVICSIDATIARARHIERGLADPERERFHSDPPVQAAREGHQLPIEPYDPPHLDLPTLVVDTTNGYHPSLDQVVLFARGTKADSADKPA